MKSELNVTIQRKRAPYLKINTARTKRFKNNVKKNLEQVKAIFEETFN